MIDGINQLPAPLFLPKGHYWRPIHSAVIAAGLTCCDRTLLIAHLVHFVPVTSKLSCENSTLNDSLRFEHVYAYINGFVWKSCTMCTSKSMGSYGIIIFPIHIAMNKAIWGINHHIRLTVGVGKHFAQAPFECLIFTSGSGHGFNI